MRTIHGMLKVLTLKCDDSSRLVSDGFERDLNKLERAALRLHLLSCTGCKRMRKQFVCLHEIHRNGGPGLPRMRVALSPEARRRIEHALGR